MTDRPPQIPRHVDLSDDDVELVLDAVRVMTELDDIRPDEMTDLFYAIQYDNLRVVVEDLLRVFGFKHGKIHKRPSAEGGDHV